MTTTEFYNTHATRLIDRYDNANMSSLHKLLLNYIPINSKVLDIGFGSGRDLQFLYENGYDIWGIDPSDKFVQNAKQRFSNISNQFFIGAIPFEKRLLGTDRKFDAVIAIAVWMHLEHNLYESAVESVVKILKETSTVIISYSEGSRVGEDRYFEEVDLEYITKLFESRGFSIVETLQNRDSLDRDTLTWVTVVLKHD